MGRTARGGFGPPRLASAGARRLGAGRARPSNENADIEGQVGRTLAAVAVRRRGERRGSEVEGRQEEIKYVKGKGEQKSVLYAFVWGWEVGAD